MHPLVVGCLFVFTFHIRSMALTFTTPMHLNDPYGTDLVGRQIAIPNTVSQEWDPQGIVTFTHECDWDSTVALSSTCPNGTDITTVCTGEALVRPSPGGRWRPCT